MLVCLRMARMLERAAFLIDTKTDDMGQYAMLISHQPVRILPPTIKHPLHNTHGKHVHTILRMIILKNVKFCIKPSNEEYKNNYHLQDIIFIHHNINHELYISVRNKYTIYSYWCHILGFPQICVLL